MNLTLRGKNRIGIVVVHILIVLIVRVIWIQSIGNSGGRRVELRTKTEIMEMKFKCPFCGRYMVCIDNDWTDSRRVNGELHSVRKLIFEHEHNHLEGKSLVESDCRGGSLTYYFIESKKDSEKQVLVEEDIE